MSSLPVIQGRGTQANPPNRFERLHLEPDFEHIEATEDFAASPKGRPTTYLLDTAKTIIAENDSPDVGFSHSINAYRGCSHGCAYCFARPTHEYLGFSAGLDFESKIMVKLKASALLRQALMSPKYRPLSLAMSGVTDCYQPAEKQFKLTRGCLEVLVEFKNPCSIITKNRLITRDVDLLSELAKLQAVGVMVSLTTLDAGLSAKMEPRTSSPKNRLETIRKLTAVGIPTGVMVAPVIPGLTDHEVPSILQAAADAGASFAGTTPLRLPWAVAPIFEAWLADHFPDRKDKVLNRIRSMRGGKLNDPNFGTRMRGEGVWAEQLKSIFQFGKRAAGIVGKFPELSTKHFQRPGDQLNLW
jgi:DNA repair photolyase